MAKTVTIELGVVDGTLQAVDGTLFLGEEAKVQFAGYTPEDGRTLRVTVFADDGVTPLADNHVDADILDLRSESLRKAFNGCQHAKSFKVSVIEIGDGGSSVIATGTAVIEWSPFVFDEATGEPATLKGEQGKPGKDGRDGAPGKDGKSLTWNDLTSEQKASLKGAKGEQGIQGIQGATGSTGAKGDRGEKGAKGDSGVSPTVAVTATENGHIVTITDAFNTHTFVVSNGAKGERGEQGIQGIQGIRGLDGQPGAKGEKGDRGEKGEQGIQGPPGEKGDRGEKGEQGERGERGEKGERGIQGPKGEPGENALAPNLAPYAKTADVLPRYVLVTAAIADGKVTVAPYTNAKLASDGTAFEVAVGGESGYMRDCVLRVECGDIVPTITWGDNFHPRTDAETDFKCEAGKRNVYWITEYAPNEFAVAGWQETTGGNAE